MRVRACCASAVYALLAACGGGSSYSTPPSPPSGAAAATATPPAALSPATQGSATAVRAVEGAGDPTTTWKFNPAQVKVRVGQPVTFTNTGKQTHTATADDGSFDVGTINPGESKSITFPRAGTFAFHCSLHPFMKGVITVTAAGASSNSGGSGY
jgi:plastocyanin